MFVTWPREGWNHHHMLASIKGCSSTILSSLVVIAFIGVETKTYTLVMWSSCGDVIITCKLRLVSADHSAKFNFPLLIEMRFENFQKNLSCYLVKVTSLSLIGYYQYTLFYYPAKLGFGDPLITHTTTR